MLQGLSGAAEAAGLLLVADSFECEGRSLLKSFVVSAALREEPVHVFNFEISETEFSNGLDDSVRLRLHFHDGFSDPLNWDQTGSFNIDGFTAPELLRRIGTAQGDTLQPCTVVLDSLSWILQRTRIGHLCRILQDFQRGAADAGLKIRKVLGLLHMDLHQPEVLEAVSHIASTVVTLTAHLESNTPQTDFLPYTLATTIHKRKSGRVLKKEEYFTVEDKFTLKTSVEPILEKEAAQGGDAASVDPAANLTFNLRLTDGERLAKERVPLPYHFSAEKKTSLLEGGAGEGRIYYEPDGADDVDEEDPDDDLDI